VHIRSFSKSHGPDLRLAAVGGVGEIIETLASRRLLGPGWSSRILQAVLIELLRDPGTADTLAHAREVYQSRRQVLSDALSAAGVEHVDGDGLNLWMRVADERSALVQLASHGIGAAPGTPFLSRSDDDHLRITVSQIADDDAERIATLLVEAADDARIRSAIR
jgi:DNA-binding transcriptional MocR family regulator